MPTIFHGIGTWYYGKRNLHKREAICPNCGIPSTLSTYDTRLWFMFYFIPLIPLGRKHIIDQCSRCEAHFAPSMKNWIDQKNRLIETALVKMENAPNDPNAAIDLHRAYLFAQEKVEGEKLLAFMLERFPTNAEVQFYVGAALDYLNRGADAQTCYERALSIDPEMFDAKRALGNRLIKKGELDEARKHLNFLESSSDLDDSRISLQLAKAYQNAKRYKEALEFYDLAMSRNDKFKNDRIIKMHRANTERSLQGLPPRGLKRSTMAAVAAGFVLLVLCADFFASQNQTVYVVSNLIAPVTVDIQGNQKLQVSSKERQIVKLSEGKHHVVVTGALKQEFDLEIKSTFLTRMVNPPVHIINVGGSALLLWESTVYSANPGKGSGDYSFHFGRNFETFESIDYPFKAFPTSITLDKHKKTATKTRVDVLNVPPSQVFLGMAGNGNWFQAMKLAEWHIRLHPDDSLMLSYYIASANKAKHETKSRAFLKEMCAARPIQVQIHRAYQETRATPQDCAAMIAEYDKLLATDPNNTALLYLRGRITDSMRESKKYFAQALQSDPNNAYAAYATAHVKILEGDWAAAAGLLKRAEEIAPGQPEFTAMSYVARLATGDFTALESELRATLANNIGDSDSSTKLCEVLIAQNRTPEALTICKDYDKRFGRKKEYTLGNQRLQAAVLYSAGDFEGLDKLTLLERGDSMKYQRFIALAAKKRLADAEKLLPLDAPDSNDPFHFLTMSAAFKQANDDERANAWRERGIELLAAGRPDMRRVAEILRSPEPPPLEEVIDKSLPNVHTAIVLAVLSQKASPHKQAYAARARLLMVERDYPYHLIEEVTRGAAASK